MQTWADAFQPWKAMMTHIFHWWQCWMTTCTTAFRCYYSLSLSWDVVYTDEQWYFSLLDWTCLLANSRSLVCGAGGGHDICSLELAVRSRSFRRTSDGWPWERRGNTGRNHLPVRLHRKVWTNTVELHDAIDNSTLDQRNWWPDFR